MLGFIVNGDILWNNYADDTASYNDIAIQDIIRDKIISEPGHILCQVPLRDANTDIIIYMFGTDPWGIICRYKATDRCYHIAFWK